MKFIIDIPDYCYEQIQEHPKGVWISKDMIKPLQAEFEEIKDEIINAYDFFPVPFGSHKAIQVIDNHIKKL